jgi:hypothetical protein
VWATVRLAGTHRGVLTYEEKVCLLYIPLHTETCIVYSMQMHLHSSIIGNMMHTGINLHSVN